MTRCDSLCQVKVLHASLGSHDGGAQAWQRQLYTLYHMSVGDGLADNLPGEADLQGRDMEPDLVLTCEAGTRCLPGEKPV